jgi:putative nucleotidyltransferase with HDIG domain
MSENLFIPPYPKALLELNAAMKVQEPDIAVITDLINKNTGLCMSLLSAINNPALGLKYSVDSITQAIMLLGQKRTFIFLQSFILKSTLDEQGHLEEFWDSSIEVASLCSRLSTELKIVDSDKAYSIGMLHDIGIPLMTMNFPKYKSFLRSVKRQNLTDLSRQEVDEFKVDHFTLGYRLAKEWNLPSSVSKTLLLQPLFDKAFDHSIKVHENLLTYLAILTLAKDISAEYRHFWRIPTSDHLASSLISTLEFLGISEEKFLEIRSTMIEDIELNTPDSE